MSTRAEKILAQVQLLKKKVQDLEQQRKAVEQLERARQSQQQRKQENRAKFHAGGLVQLAGLIDANPAQLLGGLLAVARAGQETKLKWQEEGAAMLAARAESRKVKKND